MTSRAFFHYILAFTVLLASNFAVFHGSEHIAIGKIDAAVSEITASSEHIHSEPEHHAVAEPDSPSNFHSIESLCEACLVLSNLASYSLSHTYLSVSAEKIKHSFFNLVHSKRQAFQTYLSRAPPSNA